MNNKEAKMVKGREMFMNERRRQEEFELEYVMFCCHFQMRHFQSRTCCPRMISLNHRLHAQIRVLNHLNPSILLKQNSCFLDTSNTLPLSSLPQVSHAFLLRQCHSYVQIGSRSCAACHRSFCRSFGKEA